MILLIGPGGQSILQCDDGEFRRLPCLDCNDKEGVILCQLESNGLMRREFGRRTSDVNTDIE